MDDIDDAAPSYDVGKNKPPREHRFKTGQPSANPYGRKGDPANRERNAARKAAKKAANGVSEVIRREADKRRRVTTGDGRSQEMSTLELTIRQMGNKAAAGDLPASRLFLQHLRHTDPSATTPDHVAPTCGVMVIPAAAPTLEETLLQVRAYDLELRRQDEAHGLVAPASAGRESRPTPAAQRASDPRETRAYDPGGTAPSVGRRRMADGTFR